MSGKGSDGLFGGAGSDGDDSSEDDGDGAVKEEMVESGNAGTGFVGSGRKENDRDYFDLPASLATAQHFKGITKNKKLGEVEVTVRLPARWGVGRWCY